MNTPSAVRTWTGQFDPPGVSLQEAATPLAGPAQASLARHRAAQKDEREFLEVGYDDHDLVFCDYRGLPLRPGAVTVAFEAHVKAFGLPVVRLHDTRHGACSLLLAGGVPMEIVQMILGHSSPEVTRRVYRHLMRKATAAQVQTASELLTQLRQVVRDEDSDDGAAGVPARV